MHCLVQFADEGEEREKKTRKKLSSSFFVGVLPEGENPTRKKRTTVFLKNS